MATAPTPPVDNTKIAPIDANAGTGTDKSGQSFAAANAPGKTYGTSPAPAPVSTPAVVTSAPAAAAVQSAQQKLAAATAPPPPPPTPAPNANNNNSSNPPAPTGGGNPNVNGGKPTFPAGSMVDSGTGPVQTPLNSGQIGSYQDPTTGQVTYYDVNGNVVAQPTDTSNVVSLTQPPDNASTSGGNSGNLIPGTTIPSTGDPTTDTLISTMQTQINQNAADAADIKDQLDTMRANMDQANQGLLDSISASYDDQISAQESVNAAQLAGTTQQGIRSGVSMYAPSIYQSEISSIMSSGLAKISTILDKKTAALAKAQQANAKEDYSTLYQEMQNYEKAQTDEQTQTLNLLKAVQAQKKITDTETKQAITDQATAAKTATTEATAHAWAVLEALDSATGTKGESTLAQDQAMVQQYASIYGLDPQKLLAAVEQLKQTKDLYGSSPEGQYAFYSAQTTAIGGTPMSFADWQAWSAGQKAAATSNAQQANKIQLKQTPSGSSKASASGGQLTKAQYSKLEGVGVDQSMADNITAAILSGEPLDEIRADMTKNGIDPKVLDEYDNAIGIAKLLKNKTTTSSGGSSAPPGVTPPGQ